MSTMDKMLLVRCPIHIFSPMKHAKIKSKCEGCNEVNHDINYGYKCRSCKFAVHKKCLNVDVPSRHKHPLKLTGWGVIDYNNNNCYLCDTFFYYKSIFYSCIQCSFFICVSCTRTPLIFPKTKVHEHELHQLPYKVTFTCDACGSCTTDPPCFCFQCRFIIHRRCINLARVININLHDHRLTYVASLVSKKMNCEICDEFVNGECGAYSCLVCSDYIAHSKCATNKRIWNGIDLEGVPEEDEQENKSFTIIGENLIKHFSHEHNLKGPISPVKLEDDDSSREEDKHCYVCTLPLDFQSYYKCTQCHDFILHDDCANLPRKKGHIISTNKLLLSAKGQHYKQYKNYFMCNTCERRCTGYSYNDGLINIDVRCASISSKFKHESHPHTLFTSFDQFRSTMCEGCGELRNYHLCCSGKDDCGGINICFRCATLPNLVRHKYDDHPLVLYYGEKIENSTYCCEICEEEIYSSKGWFYRCNECGSAFHTECVFSNLIHIRPEYSITLEDSEEFTLLPNRLSRPICQSCRKRCQGDLVLHNKVNTNLFKCCSCAFAYISTIRL